MSLGKRVDQPSWRHPETTGKGKLGAGKGCERLDTNGTGMYPQGLRGKDLGKEGVIMRRRAKFYLMALLVSVTACFLASPVIGFSQELPIRRVILYKHGVGYFERIGSVEGDATCLLRFKARDMSDLLKSLTVLDLGGGSIRTIAYDSTKTVEQQLGEYTFDLKSAQGLPAILDQMKGSEIALTVGQTELTGRLLSVEKRTENMQGGGIIERYRISVLLSRRQGEEL